MAQIDSAPAAAERAAGPVFGNPDPVVTANIYCAGHLDRLLLGCLAPFWKEIRQRDPERSHRIWFVRYRRGGDHLKVRIHAPAAAAPMLREQLQEAVERFFATLPPPAADAPKSGRSDVPPIDAEDRSVDDYPDHSLLFTAYERSFITFGANPLLQDDLYASYLTEFLADGAEKILSDLQLDASGVIPHGRRQNLLMKVLIGTLATLDFSEAKRTDYLRHHRDWLLRFTLLKVAERAEKAASLLARFGRQIEAMGTNIGPVERTLQRIWDHVGADQPGSPLRLLAQHLEEQRGNADYQLDPFTDEPAFTGLFKALHGFANQLGLPAAEEAFTHHLLLQIRAPEKAASSVRFMPD